MATWNQIGPHYFRNFLGPSPPGRLNETIERIDVAGIDYSILRKKGFRSQNFQFDSIVDCPSYLLARAQYYTYTTDIGAAPSKLVWAGYDYDTERIRFAVTGVELVEIRRRLIICGALYPGNTYDLVARWTGVLVPVE